MTVTRVMDRDLCEIPIQYMKGVGPHRATLLSRLRIATANDSLYYLPCRYENRKKIKKIHELIPGERETTVGSVTSAKIIHLPKSRFKIFELIISDGTEALKGKWFNQPYMKKLFRVGQEVILSGVVKQCTYQGAGYEMDKPEYELTENDTEEPIHTSRIVPIYRTTTGLSVRVLRSIIFGVLQAFPEEITDPVPREILRRTGLPSLKESLSAVHFPPPETDIGNLNRGVSAYQRRLCFDELFYLEIGIAVMRNSETRVPGIGFAPQGKLVRGLLDKLVFRLTDAQERVFREILQDMRQPYPMHRLLQGDVGCGKTIIALMVLLTAVECGYQGALMAPTEILAEQHYISIHDLLGDMGLSISLLTSGRKEKPLADIASGEIDIVVGTHALIQQGVRFKRLGVVVIDEQHRFGVMQRAALKKKANNPDVLVMTATPIPRTLAMTLYGDLDYSVIDQLPPNRTPVTTSLLFSGEKRRIYETISSEVRKGRQVYVVYPVIEGSESTDLKSAVLGKAALEKIFPDFRTGLVHGKMKTGEREAVMSSFKKREVDILVCTTVIEVGVDVPNATLMLIVHAERFGLSQLHQLRGRVGRGGEQSYCFLLAYDPCSEEAKQRLSVMVRTCDGFRIAAEDLEIRGSGEFFGTRQSGMPDLKIADVVRDAELLETARKEAFSLISEDPELNRSPDLKRTVQRFWEGKLALFNTA